MSIVHITIEELNTALKGIIDMAQPPVRTEIEAIKTVTDAIHAAHPDLAVTIDIRDGEPYPPIILRKCMR